jgi:hypothetical protein
MLTDASLASGMTDFFFSLSRISHKDCSCPRVKNYFIVGSFPLLDVSTKIEAPFLPWARFTPVITAVAAVHPLARASGPPLAYCISHRVHSTMGGAIPAKVHSRVVRIHSKTEEQLNKGGFCDGGIVLLHMCCARACLQKHCNLLG